jgi:hypothetical protein
LVELRKILSTADFRHTVLLANAEKELALENKIFSKIPYTRNKNQPHVAFSPFAHFLISEDGAVEEDEDHEDVVALTLVQEGAQVSDQGIGGVRPNHVPV